MIALLDTEKQQILLYTEDGMEVIPFYKANTLVEYVGGKSVTYVTHGMEASAEDIIEVVASLGVHLKPVEQLPDTHYLHNTTESPLYINEQLKFNGKYDCKLLDEEMMNIIEKEPILKKLISSKKIEIIGEARKRKLKKELDYMREKKEQIRQKDEEQRTNKLLMSKSVKDWDGKINETEDHDDIISIDITSDVVSGSGKGISDLLREIEGD